MLDSTMPRPDAAIPRAGPDLARPSLVQAGLSAAGAGPLYVSDASQPRRRAAALEDLATGLRRWRLPAALARRDIRNRYRGSVLGPFWLTLSTGVMVAALGLLYSTLFKMDLPDYLPFLAVSLVLWGFVSSVVAEGCACFTQSEGMIRSVRMPFVVYAARVVVRNMLVLAHNVLVILVVYAAFNRWPGASVLLATPGLALGRLYAVALRAYVEHNGALPQLVLLANHGIVAIAPTTAGVEAVSTMAVKGARVRATAYAVGGVAPLSDADVEKFFARDDIAERRANLARGR